MNKKIKLLNRLRDKIRENIRVNLERKQAQDEKLKANKKA